MAAMKDLHKKLIGDLKATNRVQKLKSDKTKVRRRALGEAFKMIGVKVTAAEHKAIKEKARKRAGGSISNLVRKAVAKY